MPAGIQKRFRAKASLCNRRTLGFVGGLKSDFTFSVNSHNHSINVAIQQILNKLTPQEMVNVLRKVSTNKNNTKKIGLAGENVSPHEKVVEQIVKMKYALEMEKSSEEALTQQSKDLMQRITSLSVKVDDATAYVERLKDGLVLLEDNVKHQNFTF